MNDLERQLRALLEPVELVCDAQIPESLVDEAEAAIRPLCNSWRIEQEPAKNPATLVTYFAIRGSERYEFNGVWRHLGVTENSSRAGHAFLRSLARLSLPTFEAEVAAVRARRFLAPMLMHGAFPAHVAYPFVERVEQELRIGVVGADEARRRLLRDSDIVSTIRRPATRLLEWAPDYAERLIDAVIDHIEDPSGPALSQLPFHLRSALEENTERRRGLRRLRPPRVVFELWTGFGPEVVAAKNDQAWRLDVGGRIEIVDAEDRYELSPDVPVTAEAGGRRVPLWKPGQVWFFYPDGPGVDEGAALPLDCVVLLPRSSVLSGPGSTQPHEIEHGVALSGAWSAYRSVRLGLAGLDSLRIVAADGQVRTFPVSDADVFELDGPIVEHVSGPDGGAVFSAAPTLRIGSVPEGPLLAWFAGVEGSDLFARLEMTNSRTSVDLAPLLGHRSIAGTLTVRPPEGVKRSLGLTMVPGLRVDVPTQALGPNDPAEITLWVDDGILTSAESITVIGPDSEVPLPINALPPGTVTAHLPRVRWGLRTSAVGRLELAPGAIRVDVHELINEPTWLIVRCGTASRVGLRLLVDGQHRQEIPARATTLSGSAHHRSFELSAVRDTLRANAKSSIQIDLDVDGVTLRAIECGEVVQPDSDRTWTSTRTIPPARQDSDGSTWTRVPWLETSRNQAIAWPEVDLERIHELELRLRLAGDAQAVVTFLRLAGVRSRKWKLTEFPTGPSAADWKKLNEAADSIWRLNGQRLRLFASDTLEQRLSGWARSWRDQLRRAPAHDRSDIEQWLLGRIPPFDRMSDWAHDDWMRLVLPSKAHPGVQWLPAILLYHCIAVAAGDEDSGPMVADAATVAPQLLLEAVAFIMQALWVGKRFQLPVISDLSIEPDDEIDEAHDFDDDITRGTNGSDDRRLALPPLLLSDSVITVEDHTLRLQPAVPEGPIGAPTVRISHNGRAEYIALSNPHQDHFTVEVPLDLSGELTVQYVVGHQVLNNPGEGVAVRVGEARWHAPKSAQSSHSLSDLAHARADALVDLVRVAASEHRLRDAPVDELFEDEHEAADTLIRLARRTDNEQDLDRVALAVLPTAMLFSSLVENQHDLVPILHSSRLIYACLAPRNNISWRALGWPANIGMGATTGAADALIGWARRLARDAGTIATPTWRYADTSAVQHHELIRLIVRGLTRHDVDGSFIDLLVATHRVLVFDQVTPEATRMLLSAYDDHPTGTRSAVLAGIATHLITRS